MTFDILVEEEDLDSAGVPARRRVRVQRDEEVSARGFRHHRALLEVERAIGVTRHHDAETAALELGGELRPESQIDVLLANSIAADRTGVASPVPRVDDDCLDGAKLHRETRIRVALLASDRTLTGVDIDDHAVGRFQRQQAMAPVALEVQHHPGARQRVLSQADIAQQPVADRNAVLVVEAYPDAFHVDVESLGPTRARVGGEPHHLRLDAPRGLDDDTGVVGMRPGANVRNVTQSFRAFNPQQER